MKIYLHAGLPRTATTVLQAQVFPKLATIHYVGKNPDNKGFSGRLSPLKIVRAACEQHLAGHPAGLATLRRLLPTVLHALKIQNRDKTKQVREAAALWIACVRSVAGALADRPILYSDESLSESMSGISGNLQHGDGVALEQLYALGFLKDVVLSVVLREPRQFLTASYYKAMEFQQVSGLAPTSFDDYIVRQLKIHERHPSASRIFLCRHRTAAAHFRRLCPAAVITSYRDLVASSNVVDTLLGTRTGEAPTSLAALPRENNSWRRPETNAFILSAPGVPAGIAIEDYAETFAETLHHHSLDSLFASESMEASPRNEP